MAHEDKTYFASLRRIRRELVYESREDLIGAEICINGPDSISVDVNSTLRPNMPELAALIEGAFFDKYVFLDLTFAVDFAPRTWARANLRLLQEYGYLPKDREEAIDCLPYGEDPMNNGSLFLLEEDLDKKRIVLRLFLQPTILSRRIHGNSRLTAAERNARAREAIPLKERKFPIVFRIQDAALTNADSIWLFKHFYL